MGSAMSKPRSKIAAWLLRYKNNAPNSLPIVRLRAVALHRDETCNVVAIVMSRPLRFDHKLGDVVIGRVSTSGSWYGNSRDSGWHWQVLPKYIATLTADALCKNQLLVDKVHHVHSNAIMISQQHNNRIKSIISLFLFSIPPFPSESPLFLVIVLNTYKEVPRPCKIISVELNIRPMFYHMRRSRIAVTVWVFWTDITGLSDTAAGGAGVCQAQKHSPHNLKMAAGKKPCMQCVNIWRGHSF